MGLDKNFNTAGANEVQLGDGQLQPDISTLGDCLKEGKPLADTGELYSTIQDAENAASSWVFVPPGTFNEEVVITTIGLTLTGAGYDTHIDRTATGGDSAIEIQADDVLVQHLRVSADDSNNGTVGDGGSSASNWTLYDVYFASSNTAVNTSSTATDVLIHSCIFIEQGSDVSRLQGARNIVKNCIVPVSNGNGSQIRLRGDDSMVSSTINMASSGQQIQIDANDCIVSGCRISGDGTSSLGVASVADSIVANCRMSEGGLSDSSTSTLTDGNLTGPSN